MKWRFNIDWRLLLRAIWNTIEPPVFVLTCIAVVIGIVYLTITFTKIVLGVGVTVAFVASVWCEYARLKRRKR